MMRFSLSAILTLTIILLNTISCSTPNSEKKEVKDQKADTIISFEDIKPKKNLPKRLNNGNIVAHLEQYGKEHDENKVVIHTEFGDIELLLYRDTPLHRANFLMVIEKGIYVNTQFSRVVKGFVIQGGSSNETFAADKKFYLGEYTIPAEMKNHHIHKYGALAMSRTYTGNEDKRSDAFDFYIVLGEKMYDRSLYQIQKEKGISYSDKEIKLYKTIGGTPHLDGEHTVFGEVTKGMDIVEKINAVEVDNLDWPKEDVVINLEVIK